MIKKISDSFMYFVEIVGNIPYFIFKLISKDLKHEKDFPKEHFYIALAVYFAFMFLTLLIWVFTQFGYIPDSPLKDKTFIEMILYALILLVAWVPLLVFGLSLSKYAHKIVDK